MKEYGICPNRIAYNSVMDLAVKSHELNKAMLLVEQMQSNDIVPDGFTYSIILTGLKLNSSKKELVVNSLKKIKLVLESDNFKQDEVLYNSILDLCCKYDLYEQMREFHELMLKNNIFESRVTCGILIKAFGKEGNFKASFEIFEKMIHSNIEIDDITYGCILEACSKSGKMDIAMKIFESLKKNEINLNSIVFTTIVKGFGKAGAFDKAIKFFNQIKAYKDLPGMIITYNCALDIYAQNNRTQAALQLFQEIDRNYGADLISFSTLIKALCAGNMKKLALEYLKKMINSKITFDISVVNLYLE